MRMKQNDGSHAYLSRGLRCLSSNASVPRLVWSSEDEKSKISRGHSGPSSSADNKILGLSKTNRFSRKQEL
ncbi:hypothetical protein DUNSADRAFT_5557 [Dunaliella salina]|uniref:Encoded protein n=1 Tax=Dunaliella salina TaxID=3046 RepID=A0ABQ7GQ01_DUNSA|nr:hypothetical protein DUNSADRAFT_5557 [Dunaliella salina]|eukprot:KAF5836682.1 hypothetical protein DUNSADRAFT_5557 [Dunaliella salina]